MGCHEGVCRDLYFLRESGNEAFRPCGFAMTKCGNYLGKRNGYDKGHHRALTQIMASFHNAMDSRLKLLLTIGRNEGRIQ